MSAHAAAGVALWGFYFVLALLYPGGMGFGDVKLSFVLGLALGVAFVAVEAVAQRFGLRNNGFERFTPGFELRGPVPTTLSR